MENSEGKLGKVPECGIIDFSDEIASIPENALVTNQVKHDGVTLSAPKMTNRNSASVKNSRE
jgi:hypothetical protein